MIDMTKEQQYVVNPLARWFQAQKVNWKIYKPFHEKSETGWDIEVRRKNQDLLIEAKYIHRSFISSFAGLVVAPLSKRPQHLMKGKYRSWSHGICWAIGSSRSMKGIYQILFDYFARNLQFWDAYGKLLKMKYIFFIEKDTVKKVMWKKFLKLSIKYSQQVRDSTKLAKRRHIAADLINE